MINHPNRGRRSAAARKIASSATPRPSPRRRVDHGYDGLLDAVRRRFYAIQLTGEPLFQTERQAGRELADVYLDGLPSQRKFHDCSACRRFLRTYGGLARINAAGQLESAMWNPDEAPEFYKGAFAALHMAVRHAKVTSVFLSSKDEWGTARTGEWRHFAVTPLPNKVYRGRALSAGQAMAAARENVATVRSALAEFTPAMLDQALRLFESEALDRAEKFVAPVRWLRALHDRPKGRLGDNLLWRAVATAPEGFCHPKASVVAPLLADIAAGLPFETIRAKHAAKVDSLRYQRPQAPPAAGNVAAAEKLVEKLGLAPALERRFARLEDVDTLWVPPRAAAKPPAAGGGVFSHIRTKDEAPEWTGGITIPATAMTWEKFARVVLPRAERVELKIPVGNGRFIALTTAVHADAPRLLKWDVGERRNPVAWYVYHGGSPANQWGLIPGVWTEVTAVAALPTMWGERPMPHLGEGAVLILKGAADRKSGSGNALFPECLRDDLHGARATIEAYSMSAELSGREEASACGYDVRKGSGRGAAGQAECDLRVRSDGGWTCYHVDRWD